MAKTPMFGHAKEGHGHTKGTDSGLSAAGSLAGSTSRPAGSDRVLADRIVAALRVGPRSGNVLAQRLGRNRQQVLAACRALAENGRLARDGNAWVLAPAGRCQGTNDEDQQCGREAQLGSDRCTLHQGPTEPVVEQEPSWHYPWSVKKARTQVNQYSPRLAGPYKNLPAEQLRYPFRCIEEGHRSCYLEARAFLQWHDAAWIEGLDAGTLDRASRFGRMLRRLVQPRPTKPAIDPSKIRNIFDIPGMEISDDDQEDQEEADTEELEGDEVD